MSVTTSQPAQPASGAAGDAATGGAGIPLHARRRRVGVSLGSLPVANLVVLEAGGALALMMLAASSALLPVAGAVALIALVVAFARRRGRWFTQWFALSVRYRLRSRTRVAHGTEPVDETEPGDEAVIKGADDPRVALLRLAVPDLVVVHGVDHERRPLGMAWHDGVWSAVLLIDPAPTLVTPAGAASNLPLSALAPCLEDRGVVLDSIQVIWHCYPGSTALPPQSPALAAYMEVLGPLPAVARRTAWVVVRLDPKRCPAAVQERGGGAVGAQRALIGALSRVRSALEAQGVPTRPLDPDELLKAGISAAELTSAAGAAESVRLRERWDGVTAGGVGHATYAITGWPHRGMTRSLNALTSVRAMSATVAVSISLNGEEGEVGLRSLVRVSARSSAELGAANERMRAVAGRLGLTITPLQGLQVAGLAATLPLGGAA